MPLSPEAIAKRLIERAQPTAALFIRTLITCDAEAGFVEATFDVPKSFATPTGFMQGGFAAAILDDLAALAAIIRADMPILVPTLSFTTNFLRPIATGQLRGDAHCRKLGRSTAFMEARLLDQGGQVLATMSVTAKIVPLKQGLNHD